MSDSILARCAKAQHSAVNNEWPPVITTAARGRHVKVPTYPLTLRYIPMVLTFLSPSSRGRAGRKLVSETGLGLSLLTSPSPWALRSHCPLPGHRVALHGILKPLPEFLQDLEALILMITVLPSHGSILALGGRRDVNSGCPSGYRHLPSTATRSS